MGKMPGPMIEMLLGHRGKGLDPSYLRPEEDEVLKAYKEAVPNLTVSEADKLRDALERRDTEHTSGSGDEYDSWGNLDEYEQGSVSFEGETRIAIN